MMNKFRLMGLLLTATTMMMSGCKQQDGVTAKSDSSSKTLSAVAQTSGQLASGTSFRISGSGPANGAGASGLSGGPHIGGHHGGPHGGHFGGPLDGTNLLAPTNELLAIIEAESAGDVRGMHMHQLGGATITNYNQAGDTVSIPQPPAGDRPEGCSFSGGQFPEIDSLLSAITKTIIDFGTGVTQKHDTISITRSGKIVITRSGDKTMHTEVVTFDGYAVNGNLITGTKTRMSTLTRAGNVDTGTSSTRVSGGQITFSDGTVASWTSDHQRNSFITIDTVARRPVSGAITNEGSTVVKDSDGTIIYSHTITKTLTENVACGRQHHGPVSGTVDTIYKANTISIDFGDGNCNNTSVSVTINGVTTTQTIGG